MTRGIYGSRITEKDRLERLKTMGIGERNICFIEEFNRVNRNKGAKEKRRIKLIDQTVALAKILKEQHNLNLDQLNHGVIEDLMGHIYGKEDWRSYTKHDYYRLIRQLCQRHSSLSPDLFKDIKFTENLESKSERETIIMDEDINKVLNCCENVRNRAFISLLHETGMRIGEILGIRFKDILKFDKCWEIKIDGKTGVREIIIVKSIRFLIDYINSLGNYSPDDVIWKVQGNFYRNSGRSINYAGANKVIHEAFVKAGLGHVKHNPHFFRHSRATLNASWMTEFQMNKFFGWSSGSDQAAVYVRMSGVDVKNAILKQNGINPMIIENKTCPTCGEKDFGDRKICPVCGTPLNLEFALKHKEEVREQMDASIDLLLKIAKNPDLLARFEAFKRRLDQDNKVH